MSPKIDALKIKLDAFRTFVSEPHTAREVVVWVSDCVALFTFLKVPDSVISAFLRVFESSDRSREKNILESLQKTDLGPFTHLRADLYAITEHWLDEGKTQSDILPLTVAFQTAAHIIDNMSESERLVPKTLLKAFETDLKYAPIYSTLSILEKNYEEKNGNDLAANAIALLGCILNLEPTLNGHDLSNQLSQIRSNRNLQQKFGIEKEIITALDNSRVLRNYLVSHKDLPIEYNFPFSVSLGTAYLVIMVVQIVMATGMLIEIPETAPPVRA